MPGFELLLLFPPLLLLLLLFLLKIPVEIERTVAKWSPFLQPSILARRFIVTLPYSTFSPTPLYPSPQFKHDLLVCPLNAYQYSGFT